MGKRRFWDRLPLYLLWAVFAALFTMWLFQLLTDTSRDKKLVLMIDAPRVESVALMRRLTKELPNGIDMIKVRPFSYAMFTENSLKEADIWIVQASDIESYLPDFGPVEGFREKHPELDYWTSEDGLIWGVLVHKGIEGAGPLNEYIQFAPENEPGEDYYLFFNPASIHLENKGGDGAAFILAELLLTLP